MDAVEARSPLDAYRRRRVLVRALTIAPARTCWSLKVRCPFCDKIHKHGGGKLYYLPVLGSRCAHCFKGTYYIIPPQEFEGALDFGFSGGLTGPTDPLLDEEPL
jgi:hypothetical protein